MSDEDEEEVEEENSEDDLFEDFPSARRSSSSSIVATTSKQQPIRNVKKDATPPPAKPSTAAAVFTTTTPKKKKLFFDPSPARPVAGCVLCYAASNALSRCRKCYIRACPECSKNNNTSPNQNWTCSECSTGGGPGGLDVLLGQHHTSKSIKLPRNSAREAPTAKRKSYKRSRKSL